MTRWQAYGPLEGRECEQYIGEWIVWQSCANCGTRLACAPDAVADYLCPTAATTQSMAPREMPMAPDKTWTAAELSDHLRSPNKMNLEGC